MRRFVLILISSLVVIIALPIIVKASSGQYITKCTVIVDESGEPLIGATMVIKGSQKGAVADYDGKICLTGSPKDIVIITFIGYPSYTMELASIPDKIVLGERFEPSED